MAWATTTGLAVKMFGTVFDTATTSLASACIYDAENEIKKRLATRYDFTVTPFLTTTTLPPMLISLTETLAIGYMYENMSRGGTDAYARSDRYIKRVMDNIESLLKGDAVLVDASGTAVSPSDSRYTVLANTSDYSPTFNEDDPENWDIDPEKLTDIQSERS